MESVEPALQPIEIRDLSEDLGLDGRLWDAGGDRQQLLAAIAHSLAYLQTPKAVEVYQNYPISGITHDRVVRSLQRFRHLVQTQPNARSLQAAIRREFVFYQAIGQDGVGTVAFTGYFEPTYAASRVSNSRYRYPLYRKPDDLADWPEPHPTREQLEGADGLQGGQGPLAGLELVWLSDRLEAFLIHVQGSARLQLADGTTMTVGYAGRTKHPYTSIGKELIRDGALDPESLTLAQLKAYFRQNPAALDRYLPRNRSFIFFKETHGAQATGSLSVPVTAERSIATDKTLMPPGALALIHTRLPDRQAQLSLKPISRYVLDQDTGSAIRGPGRVDLFVGTGTQAGLRAGEINGPGQLYYLLLRE